MKRLRSTDDLDSYGKDPNPNQNPNSNPNRSSLSSSSSHRSFYYKSDTVRKGLVSSSSSATAASGGGGGRYDWDRSAAEDDREGARMVRKRSEHDFEGFDRRKGFDRYRDGGGGGGGESRGYDRSLMHRSESFCGPRREFPKGFRSERDRSRREGSAVSSWRRFGSGNKEFDDGVGTRSRLEERGKGIRDVRSPTWSNSRDSGSEQSRVRSPPARGLRDGKSVSVSKSKSKSPTWSKDSVGSEQSKCVEVKKTTEEEGVQVQSGSSSEMEEGELEPEPEPKSDAGGKPESVPEVEGDKEEVQVHGGMEIDHKEIESEDRNTSVKDKDELLNKEDMEERNEKGVCEVKDVDEEVNGFSNLEGNSASEKLDRGSINGIEICNEGGERNQECLRGGGERKDETAQCHPVDEKSMQSDGERKEDKVIDLEVEVEGFEERRMGEERTENGVAKEDMTKATESLTLSLKDKGKSVVVTPTHVADSAADNGGWIEREPRDLMNCRESDMEMEGPSTRGFELFGNSPVKRQEKADQSGANSMQKNEKLMLEPLDLSLSLPNVLLPIGAAPGSPGQARSVQSLSNTFRTISDGFTASVSFSGSQSFYHNPSCSLTQNSMDFEQSVKSRPLFGGIDWQALAQNEPKNNKEVPLYQRILLNGNGSQSYQQSQPASNGQSGQGQHPWMPEGSSSKITNGLERQLSFHKQLSAGHSRHHHDDVRSPSHSVGSHDIGSTYSLERKRLMREKSNGSLYRTGSSKMDQEQFPFGGVEFVEAVIGRIVSEPIPLMARKFHEMNGQSLAYIKDSVREIMLNADKRRQISALQKALVNRPELTLEMLLKSHRVQLEILVALKTGLPDFLQQDTSVSSSDLAEIFLNLRCRNLACRSPVPVDECDCKVCSQKNGFCSSCMCLVCSKFDMASNTCSWVGCDVCLHWCHADCGLRESYIRNGRSATAQGASEMQFHCVACDHPSEMFGFVKEVFQNFAKEWSAETLSKELHYVKRIFATSKDLRGRRLHEFAGQLLARLTNKSDLPDVYSHIMAFLNGNEFYVLPEEIYFLVA